MSYLGSTPASAVLSSEDIAAGAVTLNDISFTDVPTNMDITGVIDKNTMRLAEGVTITGDVTISDDLVLAKLSDDGVGITMTTDATTRTITGSGSIESTTIAQTHSPTLTGMTGALGDAVTGSPALDLANVIGNLGSGVSLKVHVLDGFTISTGGQSSGYNIGGTTSTTHLTIASADNPDGAIFLVIGGGGRILTYPDTIFGTRLKYLEAGATWTTTNGTLIPEIITPMYAYVSLSKSYENGMRVAKYTNSSGSATQVDFKLSTYTGSGTTHFYANTSKVGIIAIRIH